uniref:hypothetical protein n=1 Tax=Oceanispirochaeta sp. TaxID=2035350 RepID=UPI00262B6558
MKLRNKFAFITGIPILGILIILTIGLLSFNVIKTDISHLNQIQTDYATILNADRDAYQALFAQETALGLNDISALREQEAASRENLDQTWDRVSGPAVNFSPGMQNDYKRFSDNFDLFKKHSSRAVELALST